MFHLIKKNDKEKWRNIHLTLHSDKKLSSRAVDFMKKSGYSPEQLHILSQIIIRSSE